MRITLRLLVALAAVVAAVALVSAWLQVGSERDLREAELSQRSRLIAESLQESVEPMLLAEAQGDLQRLVDKFGDRENLSAVAVYDANGAVLAATASLAPALQLAPAAVRATLESGQESGGFDRIDGRQMHVHAHPLRVAGGPAGALAVVQDASYIATQLRSIWERALARAAIQTVLIALVTLLVVRWSVVGPIARLADWMKQLRAGEASHPPPLPKGELFASLTREARTFARHLDRAKVAAEEEARLRRIAETLWTPDRLREHVRTKLRGQPLIVVSNREPYMHVRRGRGRECIVPAGGLVTALDPVLRASGGTWIAHGAGDADWDLVDERGRIKVPEDDPLYVLKRIRLTQEEESGYYNGFANEGLWPLCHIAHARPVFRAEDWEQYERVNQKFAQATLEELEGQADPFVLVQDFHLALVPRLLKEARKDIRVAIFWHIPWPNPEAFGICPWQRELLMGMLGADLVGFHTQYHCNNFLDTVDRALEARILWDRFVVEREGHPTQVKPFPISVAYPDVFPGVPEDAEIPDRAALLVGLGPEVRYLGVGVERMDYTKGVLERFRAIERFLEKYPSYLGQIAFVQLAAPSRTHIKRYLDFLAEVESEAERINRRFGKGEWRPIAFRKKHHGHLEILPYYRAADLCLVTSLHDGMNLVAKEFVASRDDEGGVLILSRFTGAALELHDALIVNPYDTDQMADAIHYALVMDPADRSARMRRLRKTVRENNIYRWAGALIEALAHVPGGGASQRNHAAP